MPLVMIKSDKRAREKPCLRCGYSLRRLGDATHCPECGLSVWLSLNQNDNLDMSNPDWLRRMAVGLWLMAIGSLLGLAGYVPQVLHQVAHFNWTMEQDRLEELDPEGYVPSGPPPQMTPGTQRLVAATGWVYLATYFPGLLLATWQERRYPDRLASWRIGAWASAGVAALVLLYGLVSLTRWQWSAGGFGFRLVVVAGALVTWGYLRRIAKRMPNGPLARFCGWMMLLPALSLLKVFPFCGAFLIYRLSGLFDFLPIIYLPVAAGVMGWMAVQVWKAAAAAEKNWGAETALTR
jgi:hypothetical protein